MKPRHQHGGQLRVASEKYGIPLCEWLDLSTGISPFVYPLAPIPSECWQRLPETGDGLETAAAAYYGSEYLLPVSGSEEAIHRLPLLRPHSRVGIISPAYHSHQQAWQKAGHQVIELDSRAVAKHLAELDVLLLVNPNNPTTERFSSEQLRQWHQQLAAHEGWLIVDEAYMDCRPDESLIQPLPLEGLIVLRSIGKFFGLAGIRLGFVWSTETLLTQLVALQDDWSVSHPARWAGKQALADKDWQAQQRKQLAEDATCLLDLLRRTWPKADIRGTELFVWCGLDCANEIHHQLAKQGILVRYFEQPAALRFGLPGTPAAWALLETTLHTIGINIGWTHVKTDPENPYLADL